MTSSTTDNINLKSVKQLFDQCVDIDPSQWPPLFEQSNCNVAEIEQVKTLLQHTDTQAQHQSIITSQLQDFGQKVEPNQKFGAYRIEREIGRGGMGIVFLAHRADGAYEQAVAIKITPNFASKEELKRFHLERQILAQLQHPNIAMLLDGGSTADDRPYLVIEYVEGKPITHYANEHQLNLRQRLTLFCAVCDAVGFAHDRLIIHRDLKPENILVTDEGQVKLLDFGVSKILQSEQQLGYTTMHQGITLAYASPEQVKGERSTTATDIYGLGALLYELICNKVPHPVDRQNPEQVMQQICFNEATLPSRVVQNQSLPVKDKEIKGDLDNIVAQTLRKEPILRYAGALELRQDIQRFLTGKAVLATPAGHWYRIKKFVRRHPLSSGLAAALILALNVGLLSSLHLNKQLRQEKVRLQQAQVELQQQMTTAEQVIEMLSNMFRAASPYATQGKDITVDDLLNSAVSQLGTSLGGQDTVISRLLVVLADVHYYAGKNQKAIELMERAAAIQQQLNGSLSIIELAKLGNIYRMAGQYEQADKYLMPTETALEHNDFSLDERIELHGYLGLLHNGRSRFVDAFFHFKRQYDLMMEDPTVDKVEDTMAVRFNLALMYRHKGEVDKALKMLQQVLADRKRLLGDSNPKIVETLSFLAGTYERLGRMDDALQVSLQSYELAKKIFDPNMVRYYESAITLASTFIAMGKFQQTHNLIRHELSAVTSGQLHDQRSIGNYYSYLAMAQLNLGYYQQAANSARQSHDTLQPFYKDTLAFFFETLTVYGLSDVLSDLQSTRGVSTLNQLRSDANKLWGKTSRYAAFVSYYQGLAALHLGEFEQAKKHFDFAWQAFDQLYDGNHERQGLLALAYGQYYMAQQNWQQANIWLQKSLNIMTLAHGEDAFMNNRINLLRGEVMWHLQNNDDAIKLIEQYAPKIMAQAGPQSVYHQQAKSLLEKIN